jgi:hypothetical protein
VPNVSDEAIEDAFEDIATDQVLVAGTITAQRGTVTLSATQFYMPVSRRRSGGTSRRAESNGDCASAVSAAMALSGAG